MLVGMSKQTYTTIEALHKADADHLAEVIAEMRTLGAPTIRAYWDGDGWQAIEGVHRLHAAAALGLRPILVEVRREDLLSGLEGIDWQDAQPDSTVGDLLDYAPHCHVLVEFEPI